MERMIQLVRCPVDDPNVAADQWNMPLDLLLLAGTIDGTIPVEIVDGSLLSLDEVREKLSRNASCVGFTYSALSSHTLNLLASDSKERGSFVIIGGQPATGAARSLINESFIDAVCIADGIPVVKSLAEQMVRGKIDVTQIPNVLTRTKDGTVIATKHEDEDVWSEKIPPRDTGGLVPDLYLSEYPETNTLINMGGRRAINIFSKRGCPYTCSFCARQDKRIRCRDPKLVAAEIRNLITCHEVDYILDTSDTWVNIEWAKKFADELRCDGLQPVPMMVFADSRHISPAACWAMKQCGIDSVLLGVESGSERILRENSKFTTKEAIISAVDLLVRFNIRVSCSFVLGLLGEDERSLDETLDLCSELVSKPGVVCYGNVIMPLMGSPLWAKVFGTSRTWPSSITRALDYDLTAVREIYVEQATKIRDLNILQDACKALLHLSHLEELEYAR
jgi:hypothetical protein